MGRSIASIHFSDGTTRYALYCDTEDRIVNCGVIEDTPHNLRDYYDGKSKLPAIDFEGEELRVVDIEIGERNWKGLATKHLLIGPKCYAPYGVGEYKYYKIELDGVYHLSIVTQGMGGHLLFQDTSCGIEIDNEPRSAKLWLWGKGGAEIMNICPSCVKAILDGFDQYL